MRDYYYTTVHSVNPELSLGIKSANRGASTKNPPLFCTLNTEKRERENEKEKITREREDMKLNVC